MRSPRPSDHAAWRAARLRDRKLIEPYWHSSDLDWAQRHTEREWIHEYVAVRAEVRAGRQFSGIIEIDGRFAGQCELCRLDTRAGSAELSIWIDSRFARHGFSCVAAALVLAHGFDRLGLERIAAPIAPDNGPALAFATRLGFVREALLARYFDAGGTRSDHELWSLTRADLPPEGLVDSQLRRMRGASAAGQHDSRAEVTLPAAEAHPRTNRLGTAALVGVRTARHTAWRIRRTPTLLRGDRPVRLSVPGQPRIVLRSRTFADGGPRAAAYVHRGPLDGIGPLPPSAHLRPGGPLSHGDPLELSAHPCPGDPLTHGDPLSHDDYPLLGNARTDGDPLAYREHPLPGDPLTHGDPLSHSEPSDPLTHSDSLPYSADRLNGDPLTHGALGDPLTHGDSLPHSAERLHSDPLPQAMPDPLTHGDSFPHRADRVHGEPLVQSVRSVPFPRGDSPVHGDPSAHAEHRLPSGPSAHGRRVAWWREFFESRGGLRSGGGLVLVLEVGGVYAGEYRLFDLDMFDRNARLSAWADPGRAGREIRTAALRAVLAYAVDSLGLYRVAAEIDSADTEFAEVAAAAGMLEEGRLRDHLGAAGRRADHMLWALTVAAPERGRG